MPRRTLRILILAAALALAAVIVVLVIGRRGRPERRLQRQRAAVRPPARRGGVRRDPQLDVGRRPAGLAVHAAGEGDPAQLEAGIRGLLIDMYYGIRTSRGVQNMPVDKIDGARPAGRAWGATSTSATRSARSGRPARPTRSRDVRDFLAAHPARGAPDQHRGPRPPAGRRAGVRAERADALRLARPPRPRRLPTLREMIDSDERVVAMAENRSGGVPWLQAQFDLVQETPYRFATPAEVAAATLLPPQPRQRPEPALPPQQLGRHVAAARGRATPPWSTRSARCCAARAPASELRDRLPNLVAVDFYEQGDVWASCASSTAEAGSWTDGVWSFPRNVVQMPCLWSRRSRQPPHRARPSRPRGGLLPFIPGDLARRSTRLRTRAPRNPRSSAVPVAGPLSPGARPRDKDTRKRARTPRSLREGTRR